MAKRRSARDDAGPDLFSTGSDPQTRLTLSGLPWPEPAKFPVNHASATVAKVVLEDLRTSESAYVVTGFAGIAELIDLIAARSVGDTGDMRVLLGWEPFSTSRTSFGSTAADTFTDAVRKYWIEEQGVNLQLSAKIVHSLRALEEKKLSVRFVPGNDRLHAKIYVGDRAATLGSSNFTQPGLRRQFEANARFAEDAEPGRFKDLATVAENFWKIGEPWNDEFAALLKSLLQFVGWREALARACADLLEGQWAERYLGGMEGGKDLWPSQRYGIAEALWVVENVGSVLVADATGSGKTRMGAHLTAAVRNRLWSTGRVRGDLTVVVCPPKVSQDWLRESVACGLTAHAVSHGLLSHRSSGEGRVEERAVLDAQILAIDEAHNFLSSASNRTALVRDSAADNVLLFTATPINRGAKDLLTLVDLLGADNFDDDALAILDNLYRRADRQLSDSEKALLRSEIQRFTVRRTKTMLNELVDAQPEAYKDLAGRVNRYPRHLTKEYPTGESAQDVELAQRIRERAEGLTGVALLGDEIALPKGMDLVDDEYLALRLGAAKGLAGHHVTSTLRSSTAALLEHLNGTESAAAFVGLSGLAKGASSGRQIERLEAVRDRGRPGVLLTCEVPDWLSDDEAWHERCEQELAIYRDIERWARELDDSRERAKVAKIAELARKHGRVLAFDRHPITLAVLEKLLRQDGQTVHVAVGGDKSGQKQVTELFKATANYRGIALCSDAMNEGINLQGASCIVHLDMPTTLRVAEQRVGRVDRMNSPHDEVEVWWPKDGPAFATRADDLLAARNDESSSLLGSNLPIPGGKVVDHRVWDQAADEDWDGLHDALEPVRRLVTGPDALVTPTQYERQKGGSERVIARVSPVRSSTPWAFFAVAGTSRGAPRWMILEGDRIEPVTDLARVTGRLRDLLAEDPPERAFDDAASDRLAAFLAQAARAEVKLMPRRDQRALRQLQMCTNEWASMAQRRGASDEARRWRELENVLADGDGDQTVDLHEVAAAWHRLTRPLRDSFRRTHKRKRYVTLSDLDGPLLHTPLALADVEAELSGLDLIPPLASRVSACILGVPD